MIIFILCKSRSKKADLKRQSEIRASFPLVDITVTPLSNE